MNIKKLNWWLLGGGSSVPLTAPDLFVLNRWTDQMVLEWTPYGDSFVLERSTSSDFTTGVTQILSGAGSSATNGNKTFTDTGLSAWTEYYYRIKSSASGYADSEWSTAKNAKTWPSGIVGAYFFPGLPYDTTNDYGTTVLGAISSLKSVINSGGPLLTKTAGSLGRSLTETDNPYYTGTLASAGYCDFASNIALGTGAFTILTKMKTLVNPGGAAQLYSDIVGGNRLVRFSSNTQTLIGINNVFGTAMDWKIGGVNTPFNPAIFNEFVWVSNGTTMKASYNRGTDYSNVVNRPSPGNAFNLTRFGASAAAGNTQGGLVEFMLFASSEFTDAQIAWAFDWAAANSATLAANDYTITPKGLPAELGSTTLRHIEGYTGGFPVYGQGNDNSQNHYSFGSDLHIACVHKHYTGVEDGQSSLLFFNSSTNKVYGPLNFPITTTIDDNHDNIVNISILGNSVYGLQMDRHYGANEGTYYIRRKFLNNFDFSASAIVPQAKGIPFSAFMADTQYPKEYQIGNNTYRLAQRRDPGSALPGIVMCAKSIDGGVSWSPYYPLFSTATASQWIYPIVALHPSGTGAVILIEHVNNAASPVQIEGFTAWYTTDFVTVQNLSGSYTKNIITTALPTLAEMYTNATLIDARSLTSTMYSQILCTATGMVYGVFGNGNNNGLTLAYQTIGGALVTKAVSFGGDTVVLGTQTDTTGTNSGINVYHRSTANCYFRGGTTFDVFALQVNGGNWTPTQYRTTDGGDNWTKIGILPNISTSHQYAELRISDNVHLNSNKGCLWAAKYTSGTTSIPYAITLDELA